MLRSVLAVAAGFILTTILALGTDLGIRAARPGLFGESGPVESKGALLALAYTLAFVVGGCYLAARLAPRRPLKHALILGVIGFVGTAVATAALWGTGPVWYHLATLALFLPAAWLGGRLAEGRHAG